jgi:diguanylate cyclase (GGDEF)-like protein/PAS domain S-box-containing protein
MSAESTLARLGRLALIRVRVPEAAYASLGALVEQTSDVILVIDDADRIRFASPSARVLFGTSTLQNLRLLDLIAGPERPLAEYLLRHARRTGPEVEGAGRVDLTVQAVDGRTARVEVFCRDLRSDDSVRGVAVTLRDVTGQRRLEQDLKQQVFLDQLTGLPNRVSLHDRIGQAFAVNTGVTGVILLDLDRFRTVNEGLGREIGDAVLVGVGDRLRAAVGAENLVARSGGDEFAVLVPNAGQLDTIDQVARRVMDCFATPVPAGGDTVSCGASMGVATTVEATNEQELLRHADLALDRAKAAGRARWRRYDPSMTHAARYRLELRSTLSHALEDGSLIVEYQPIMSLATGRTAGFEALVRWRHPTRGLLSPADFIDIAEESDVIIAIGEHVLTTALRAAGEWSRLRPSDPPYVSVNVSVRQFRSSGFADTVQRLVSAARLPRDRLVLEITESLLLHDDDEVWEDLKRLHGSGIRIAIDDFGTGYSALSYLRQVPLDIVKLDRLFIATMTTSTRQRELVRGIVGLIRTLHLEVVAEGIETVQQRDSSAAIGCGYGQGYLFARSMSQSDALRWLADESDMDG